MWLVLPYMWLVSSYMWLVYLTCGQCAAFHAVSLLIVHTGVLWMSSLTGAQLLLVLAHQCLAWPLQCFVEGAYNLRYLICSGMGSRRC